MDNLSAGQIWGLLLAAAGAIVVLSNAGRAIADAVKAARQPNAEQDRRLAALEEWKRDVDKKLDSDYQTLTVIKDGLRASYQAQLALLAHGIDGNNLSQMEDAKKALEAHLINTHTY